MVTLEDVAALAGVSRHRIARGERRQQRQGADPREG